MIIGIFTTFDQLGGIYGLTSLPQVQLFGWTWQRPSDWMIPLLVAVALIYAIVLADRRVAVRAGAEGHPRGRPGRRWSLGKNVFRFKVVVFAITAAMAGFAGGLLAAFLQLATPGLFGFSISLTIFAMVIFGGMGNLIGSVLGAAVLLDASSPILKRDHRSATPTRRASCS